MLWRREKSLSPAALIRTVMTYACPTWDFAADTHLMKLQCLQNGSPHHWQFSKVHTSP
jgi:hypothetical protein